jgi:hypothetical protein
VRRQPDLTLEEIRLKLADEQGLKAAKCASVPIAK